MNKEDKKIVPQLRFPEFVNDGDWEIRILGKEISYFKGFAFKSKDYTNNGRRIVRVSDMGYDCLKNEDNAIYIKEDNAIEYKRWELKKNDLIITTVGSKPPVYDSLVGRTIVVKQKDAGSLLNQNAVCLRAKNIKQKFFNYIFNRSEYINFIETIIRGNANQGSITLENLFQYNICIPKKPKEQHKIAACLSSLDEVITAENEKLDLLQDHKKGLLQQLFPAEGETQPKFRFPEFKEEGNWEETTLSSCGVFIRGLTYSSKDTSDEGLLVLRSSNIQDDRLVLDNDLVFVNKKCPKDLKLLKGDIVICMSNGSKRLVGKNAEYKGNYTEPITVGAFCSLFRPINSFVKYFFQTDKYSNFISYSIGGGNINNLKNSDLEEYSVLIPNNPLEQKKIAACFSAADELIAAQAEKIEQLQDHKKGLLQKLFPNLNELAV